MVLRDDKGRFKTTTIREYIDCKCGCGQKRISHDKYGRKKNWIKGHAFKIIKHKTGNQHWNWKGGIRKTPNSYVRIYSPNHPFHDIYNSVLEHRLVMEKHLGRYLWDFEIIHHKNGIKNDNRLENLELMTDSQHKTYHAVHRRRRRAR